MARFPSPGVVCSIGVSSPSSSLDARSAGRRLRASHAAPTLSCGAAASGPVLQCRADAARAPGKVRKVTLKVTLKVALKVALKVGLGTEIEGCHESAAAGAGRSVRGVRATFSRIPATQLAPSLLAPSAPSGGAWGDASSQTPAKHTAREPQRLVMGNRLQPHALTARLPHPHSSVMAGVWGEASPQVPPEGAEGARETGAGGAREIGAGYTWGRAKA